MPDDHPKLEWGDTLANLLGPEAEDILDEKLVNKKQLETLETLENIREENSFEEIKDAFDEISVPHELDFFYGGSNENFVNAYNFSHWTMTRGNLLPFLYVILGKI